MLGISPETCTKAVERGQLPSVQIGNRRRIPLTAIQRLAAGEPQVTLTGIRTTSK